MFSLISKCDNTISMDIYTGWLKSNIHTWMYIWISISMASVGLGKRRESSPSGVWGGASAEIELGAF